MAYYTEKFYSYQSVARGSADIRSVELNHKGWSASFAPVWDRLTIDTSFGEDAAVLDIGCGMGNLLYFLRKMNFRNTVGIDCDESSVSCARTLGLNAVKNDALAFLGTTSDTFDCIVALDFIEHLSKDDAVAFMELARDHCRPGGVFLLKIPCADSFYSAYHVFNDITHQWGITSGAMKLLLNMTGFDRVRIIDEAFIPPRVVYKLPGYWFHRINRFLFRKMLGLRSAMRWSPSVYIAAKPSTL